MHNIKRQFMENKTLILIFLLLITGLMVINANEVPKNEPVSTLQIKFNFNDKPDNEIDKIMRDVINLRNTGVSFIAAGATGFGLSFAAAVAIAGYLAYYALIPAVLLPIFGFMFVFGLLINAKSRRYLSKGEFSDGNEKLKKSGIILTSIFGTLTLFNIAGGLLYYIFFYNLLAGGTSIGTTWAFATIFLAISSVTIPFVFFMVGLPMLISGLVFSNLKKRMSAVSYLDTDKFAFTGGFSIKFK